MEYSLGLLSDPSDPTTQSYPIAKFPRRELQLGEAVGPTVFAILAIGCGTLESLTNRFVRHVSQIFRPQDLLYHTRC
jgi:hypothetical protein